MLRLAAGSRVRFDMPYRLFEDLGVIERKRREIGRWEPARIGCIIAGTGRRPGIVDEPDMRDADDALTRVAVDRAEGIQLTKRHSPDAGLLCEFPRGRLIERLIDVDEAPRQGPVAFEGSGRSAYQQNLEAVVRSQEQAGIDGDGGMRMLVAITHGRRVDRQVTG